MIDTNADECPSHFALDDQELHGDGRSELRRHVDGCSRCQARVAQRTADRAHFEQLSAPLWTRVAARAEESRRRRHGRFWFVQLPALAVGLGAAALLVRARLPGDVPGAAYVAPKGQAPVEITCRRGDRTFVLAPGDEVLPGDQLRFRPLPVWPDGRFIQIGSVDGTGRYAPFYPSMPGATSVALPPPGQALEGSIRLDAAPGPERLFVVLSATPLAETGVRQAAESGAAAGTTVDRIEGAAVRAGWIKLRKHAGAVISP